MKDESTIIGVQYEEWKNNILIIEVLHKINYKSNLSPIKFGVHNDTICTILFNEMLNTLLVGDYTGRVVQYNLNSSFYTPKMVKDYGKLENGEITSSAQFGTIATMKRSGRSLFTFINMNTRKIFIKHINSAIQYIYSMHFCRVKQNSALALVFSGECPNFSYDKTDIFDVTEIFNILNISSNKFNNNILLNKKNNFSL